MDLVSNIEILVVEDSEAKRNSIEAVLLKAFPYALIRHACSVRAAIDAITHSLPQLIIADMSLPTFDIEDRERGGTPRPFGGLEVFETLEKYDLAVPVVVVTSYPTICDGGQSLGLSDLAKRLESEFPDCYSGVVYFDSSFSDWEQRFFAKCCEALKGYGHAT